MALELASSSSFWEFSSFSYTALDTQTATEVFLNFKLFWFPHWKRFYLHKGDRIKLVLMLKKINRLHVWTWIRIERLTFNAQVPREVKVLQHQIFTINSLLDLLFHAIHFNLEFAAFENNIVLKTVILNWLMHQVTWETRNLEMIRTFSEERLELGFYRFYYLSKIEHHFQFSDETISTFGAVTFEEMNKLKWTRTF